MLPTSYIASRKQKSCLFGPLLNFNHRCLPFPIIFLRIEVCDSIARQERDHCLSSPLGFSTASPKKDIHRTWKSHFAWIESAFTVFWSQMEQRVTTPMGCHGNPFLQLIAQQRFHPKICWCIHFFLDMSQPVRKKQLTQACQPWTHCCIVVIHCPHLLCTLCNNHSVISRKVKGSKSLSLLVQLIAQQWFHPKICWHVHFFLTCLNEVFLDQLLSLHASFSADYHFLLSV